MGEERKVQKGKGEGGGRTKKSAMGFSPIGNE